MFAASVANHHLLWPNNWPFLIKNHATKRFSHVIYASICIPNQRFPKNVYYTITSSIFSKVKKRLILIAFNIYTIILGGHYFKSTVQQLLFLLFSIFFLSIPFFHLLYFIWLIKLRAWAGMPWYLWVGVPRCVGVCADVP